MSFVTKRERVFRDENDLYELPPRNEGKLKAYASCTDARAWSHFSSDHSEHLVDIIKRNNASCAPKYVPTKVIVDTIMSQKNCEISRLRRKIDTLDQMLAVYDQLELDCGQKCEIARAHESIKAASKDLDEVCLDLDMSGFTEGLESDIYETGKSRGDEIEKSKGDMSVYSKVTPTHTEAIGVQNTPPCNDAATVVKDPRIEEMRDEIIFKDAKLNAMQNSMAVLENDVCEPYCIYAHIYTALEKIYGILNQNETYRQYLELLSAGKDTRCLDIKGRILFKMKILEKFALALMAPCSKKFADEAQKEKEDCDCGKTKIVARVETTYALTSSESEPPPTSDSHRAHLVAEIMDNDEMKEILEKDTFISDLLDTGNAYCGLTCYSIDAENVKRLKDLQKSYEELMECFENLKHEKELLQVRCRKYNELEMEVETLRDQLASCNALWSEKERFRKRSSELEDIHEKYLILQNVTGNLESELKAEKEINNNKMQLIEDLRNENLILERKLSDATIAFEREKSALLCKLKEFECALSCKDQEVKNLSEQFQKHFDDNQERERDSIKTFSLLNEIELLKEELMNTKGLLNCCEEEKEHIKEKFSDNLSLVNDLRMQIEDWKDHYEKLLGQKSTMESQFRYDIADLEEKNNKLNEEMDEKTKAISNLMGIISDKSMEINTLLEEIENTKKENEQMLSELLDLRNEHSICKEKFESEKCEVQELLESERRKSKQLEDALNIENQQEILQNGNLQRKFDSRSNEYDSLRGLLENLSKENHLIREKLTNGECCQVDFKKEFERLNEIIRVLQIDKREGELSKTKLIEELNNWKQKFADLEKDNINSFDYLVAELNNCKKKLREQGGETFDNISDNYEEAESSPWKHNHAANANRENVPSSFDKSTSHLRRAEIEEGLWKKHNLANGNEREKVSSSQEHTRLSSFVENVSGRTSEYRERFSLLSSNLQTTRRFSDQPNQVPLLNVNDKALRRDSEPQTRAHVLSIDENPFDLGLRILEPNVSRHVSEVQERLWDQGINNKLTPIQAAKENIVHQDSRYEEQNILSSFDEKASLIDSELKSLSALLSAKENTSHHFFSPKETTQDILESRERSERLSYDENASDERSAHRDLHLKDQARLLSTDVRNAQSDSDCQGQIRLLQPELRLSNFDEKDSRRDSDHQTQMRLLQSELRLSSFDEKDFRRDSEPQKVEQLLSADSQAMHSDLSVNEKNLGRDSEQKPRAHLSGAEENTASLEYGTYLKGNVSELDLSKIQEKPQILSIDNKLTSHDLRPLERARSSAANEIQYNAHKDSRFQEGNNYFSDMESKDWQHEKESDNYEHNRRLSDNKHVISENKNSIQSQQRDLSYQKYDRKLSFDEKFVKDVGPWKNDRDSDYYSKITYERRPSFGKAEAEESLKKYRRYSDAQNYSSDETDQYKSLSEDKPREKKDLEEQTDINQKFDESEKESQQDQDIKLDNWNENSNLEKDTIDKQALLDKVMEEKIKLEEILRDKTNELDAAKEINQSYLEKARKSELIEGELKRKSLSYENALSEKYSLQEQLDNTNTKMAELLQSLENEKSQLLTLSTRIPDLEQKLKDYQKTINDTLDERQFIQDQLNEKTDELSKVLAENNELKDELQKLRLFKTTSDENLATLQNQKEELQLLFKAMEKEHDKLLAEVDVYKCIAEDLDNIKNDYDSIQRENKGLRDKLEENKKQFTLLDKKHNDDITALAADNKELENMLMEVREQVVRGLETPERSFYETVKDEVNALKRERIENQAEIRKLKDQQDANENLILELKGELITRDERISILENHINLLQDEISQLHKNLEDGVSASEQLQGQAFEGYDDSIKKIEAHHSKAFHNMKMEISQLEKEKADLQEQLFKTRNQNEESLRDKNEYLTKITDLTNERDIMLNELRKLEHITTGNTGFVTDNGSDIQSVKESFSRISINLEVNRSQSAALESKLHIVKKSSEELLSKTNEAKKIAENEKQKFLLEKEEAVRERSNLERQMLDLKAKFEKQRDNDAATIEDLKKEILNQQLLIKEMKDSTQEYIQKLEEDLKTLQNLYKQTQIKINDLESQLQDSKAENDTYKDNIKSLNKTHNDRIAKYNEILQKNNKEMNELQEALNDIRSISKDDTNIQTEEIEKIDFSTQIPTSTSENRKLQTDFPEKKSRANERIQEEHRKASENITKFTENITELQIMNADVQPTFDFVKNTYTKYKQGQLSPGPVEQHSILSLVNPSIKKDSDNQLIDIYSRRSLDVEESQYDKTNISHSLNINTIENNNKNKQNVSSSGQSNDEDVFLIYSSSDTVHNEQPPFLIPDTSTSSKNKENKLTLTNKTDLEKGFAGITNEMFADDVRKPREGKLTQRDRKSEREAKVTISASDEGFSLPKKQKPNITMFGNNENAGKSSQSSYNGDVSQQMLLHSSDTDDDKLKRKETQSKSNLSLNETKPDSEDYFDNLSNDQDNHFKMSRADGESKSNKTKPETSDKQDLGLNFILETAKQETKETFDYNTNLLRRSQSTESISKNSSRTAQENSFSAANRQQIVSHSIVMPLKGKKVADKEVSINIETDKASKKIEQLTAALDHCERDYKKKLEAIKAQYDANKKIMINEHNEGVKNLQSLHEDMIKDLVKKHENEVENLRSISFEAMKRVEKLEKENMLLKSGLGYNGNDILDQEPIKIDSRSRVRDARLSKTTIESFDVKPRMRHSGPCTCSLDVNVSDTIRNIFDQVDQDQRKLAEFTYVKYIAHKMMSGNVDALDSQELAFLHYNVCRHWKVKQNIEDTLRKKIDSLETELISKQRHAQQHIAELDRRVAEERRRLQEVREAVGYQPVPGVSHDMQPDRDNNDVGCICTPAPPQPRNMDAPCSPIRVRKVRPEGHCSERRVPRPQQPQNQADEMPTRLRRCQDRASRSHRK